MRKPPTFTSKDLSNAAAWANYNYRSRIVQEMHKRVPHLATKLKVTKRVATNEDFYIPPSLESLAFHLEIEFTEKLCSALSCDAFAAEDENGKVESPCQPYASASYYRIGLDKIGTRCSPACQHTDLNVSSKTRSGNDEDNTPHTPMLMFNRTSRRCLVVPSNVLIYLRRPISRATARYAKRRNDLKTSYTETYDDSVGELSTPIAFRNNEYLCRVFRKDYDPSTGECSKSFFEKWVVGSVLGNAFVDSAKDFVQGVTNTDTTEDLPSGLPPLPTETRPEDTLDAWLKDVDDTFVVPEPIDYYATLSRSARGRDASSRTKRDSEQRRQPVGGETTRDLNDDSAKDENDDDVGFWKKAGDIGVRLVEEFFSKENLLQLGVSLEFEHQLSRLKTKLIAVVSRMLKFYGEKSLGRVFGNIGARVLETGLASTLKHIVTRVAFKIVTRAAIALTKLTISALSVVGLLTIIATISDLILAFWDPYGYSNELPKDEPDRMYRAAERSMRELYKRTPVDVDFEWLAAMTLDPETMNEISMQRMTDTVFYLDALEVNSDGEYIDKGPPIRLNGVDNFTPANRSAIDSELNRTFAATHVFDPDNFRAYNEKYLRRSRLNWLLRLLGTACAVLTALSFAASINVLAIIALSLTVIFFVLSSSVVTSDGVFTTFSNVRSAFRFGDDGESKLSRPRAGRRR